MFRVIKGLKLNNVRKPPSFIYYRNMASTVYEQLDAYRRKYASNIKEVNVTMLGVGIGAILLSVLWIVAFLFCFISLRTRYNIGPMTVAITILVTIVLLSVPRKGDEAPPVPGEKILDPFFVWRTSILLLLGLCAISSTVFVIITSIMEVKQARPMKLWYLKS